MPPNMYGILLPGLLVSNSHTHITVSGWSFFVNNFVQFYKKVIAKIDVYLIKIFVLFKLFYCFVVLFMLESIVTIILNMSLY